MIKKVLIAAMLAASVGGIVAPATATAATVYVQIAPPEPRYEAVPESRRGHVWAPGYWDWRGHQHVWHAGSWQRERPGYRYHESRWVEHDNGRWSRQPARWARHDRDGDGVPDRYDRHPDNPRRN